MRPFLRPLIGFAFFASLFTSVLVAQQSSPCPCTFRGTIVDSVTGQPIHGALVSASGGSSPPTLTDAEGKFQFDGLPTGTINLQAAKPGYSSHDGFPRGLPASFAVDLGPDTPPATLKLTPEGVIYGKVTDENGEPLEGFSVSLVQRSAFGGQFFPDRRSQSVTDDEGNFRIADLARGSCYVVVQQTQVPVFTAPKDSAAPQGFPTVYFPGVSDLSSATLIKILPGKSVQANFSLKRVPFVRISGTVTSYNRNDNVQLALESSSGEPLPVEFSFDPASGAFHSKWIPPGTYTLQAQSVVAVSVDASRSLSVASQAINATSDLSGIHLTLQPTANISVDLHGDVPPELPPGSRPPFLISLVPRTHSPRRGIVPARWVPRGENSEGNGYMLFQGVQPGTYGVELWSDGTYYVESAIWGSTDLLHDDFVVTASGSAPPIDLTIREGVASIGGSVVSSDQRTSATVLILASGRRQWPKVIPTDARGDFSMPNLAPGTYRVIAVDDLQAFDYENPDVLAKVSSYIQEVTLTAKQTASLRLELARVGD